jgi:hypothetical protein
MPYNRRDQIGHWVRRDQQIYRPCHHACCRGYRAHPHNWPIVPADHALRRATDDQLARHYAKATADESPQGRRAELKILNEFERRDRADMRRAEKERAYQARAASRAAQRMDMEAERERIRVDAEATTRGYLVNRKGRARGIDPEEILTGRQAVFERYASDEARDYFRVNPRPTAAYFRGRNTHYVERSRALCVMRYA